MTDKRDQKPHPMQPMADDGKGVMRFKENEIVRRLLDDGKFDLNDIARWDVSREDREQFAQLIGYSVSAWGGLGYADTERVLAADTLAEKGGEGSLVEAELAAVRSTLNEARTKGRDFVATLYAIHPDDLEPL